MILSASFSSEFIEDTEPFIVIKAIYSFGILVIFSMSETLDFEIKSIFNTFLFKFSERNLERFPFSSIVIFLLAIISNFSEYEFFIS